MRTIHVLFHPVKPHANDSYVPGVSLTHHVAYNHFACIGLYISMTVKEVN